MRLHNHGLELTLAKRIGDLSFQLLLHLVFGALDLIKHSFFPVFDHVHLLESAEFGWIICVFEEVFVA